MRKDTHEKFIALGFDTSLIDKISSKLFTLSTLKGFSKKQLLSQGFTEAEALFIIAKVNRQPIADNIVNNILIKSGACCCYCADGVSQKPYQLHHIEEYHKTQDNSEGNLLLVCPTHHVLIHDKKIPVPDQLLKKRNWEKLWEIASGYQEKAIAFPFGALEHIDYDIPGKITDIFSFGTPKPSVCQLLSSGATAYEAIRTLEKEHKLILAGSSGSGKTTLAIGIAGMARDYSVYKFTSSAMAPLGIVKEILLLLSLIKGRILLIIDDANTILAAPQIETVLNSASEDKKIIIVNTRSTLSSQGNIEQHFSNTVIPISWKSMQDEVKANLMRHETEIVEYLHEKGLSSYNGNPIGFNVFDMNLRHVMDAYAKDTETVWQFIFMLASGEEKIHQIKRELYDKDRLDIIVLFIGLNQVARVEDGTTIEEIQKLYTWHPALKGSSPPSNEWLGNRLQELISIRILKENRGRYNTVHRQFAIRYLDACYLFSKNDTDTLLGSYFTDKTRIREILILWSWLRNSIARNFLSSWHRSLSLEEWLELGEQAGMHSMASLALLVDMLHSGEGNKLLAAILANNTSRIASYINSPDKDMFYHFSKISTGLRYHAKEQWQTILDKLDHERFTSEIKAADPEDFESIDHIFYAIAESMPVWVINFSKNFRLEDFRQTAAHIKSGDVDTLCQLAYFQRRYIADFKKSDMVFYADQMARILRGASIESFHISGMHNGLWDLGFYKDLVNDILASLDSNGLANEFVNLSPLKWEKLFSLFLFLRYGNLTLIADILDKVDIPELIDNMHKYGPGNAREKKIVMVTFMFANPSKRAELLNAIYPLILETLKSFPAEHESKELLFRFHEFAPSLATKACNELAIEIREPEPDDRVDDEDNNVEEMFESIRKEEETGTDYVLYGYLLSEANLPVIDTQQ